MNPETFEERKIKGGIAETIIEYMLRDLGFFVIPLGQEKTINPITQLEFFINQYEQEFKLKRHKYIDDPISNLSTLPDFAVIDKAGNVHFVEVKFRKNGCLGDNDENIFYNYHHTLLIVVNLELSDYIKKIVNHEITDDVFEELKKTRFHVWINANYIKTGMYDYGEGDTSTNLVILEVATLNDCFQGLFQVDKKDVIEKYESYVDKYLRKPLTDD
jgi:hypothetical protein